MGRKPKSDPAPAKSKKHVRAHNEGTIFQRKDGRWVTRIVVGTLPNGKPDKREIYCRTKPEAVEALKTLHKEINQRQDHRGGEPFESFLMRWLDKSKLAKVRQNTWELYAGDIANHIIPDLGETPIADIETSQIQTLMDKMTAKGYSSSVFYIEHALLSAPAYVRLCQIGLSIVTQQLEYPCHPIQRKRRPYSRRNRRIALSQ